MENFKNNDVDNLFWNWWTMAFYIEFIDRFVGWLKIGIEPAKIVDLVPLQKLGRTMIYWHIGFLYLTSKSNKRGGESQWWKSLDYKHNTGKNFCCHRNWDRIHDINAEFPKRDALSLLNFLVIGGSSTLTFQLFIFFALEVLWSLFLFFRLRRWRYSHFSLFLFWSPLEPFLVLWAAEAAAQQEIQQQPSEVFICQQGVAYFSFFIFLSLSFLLHPQATAQKEI